jgi:hypothetical protein
MDCHFRPFAEFILRVSEGLMVTGVEFSEQNKGSPAVNRKEDSIQEE